MLDLVSLDNVGAMEPNDGDDNVSNKKSQAVIPSRGERRRFRGQTMYF